MIGAGTFINPLLKVVTTVAILGAVYLFIVKPALDTTKDITDRAFDASGQIQQDIRQSIERSGASPEDFKIPVSAKKAQRLGECANRAGGDQGKIQACFDRFGP